MNRLLLFIALLGALVAAGCATATPKPGSRVKVNTGLPPPPLAPAVLASNGAVKVPAMLFKPAPRPTYVTIPKSKPAIALLNPSAPPALTAPKSAAWFSPESAATGPNHFAGMWVDGPEVAYSGDQITVSAHMKNLCDFGDTMRLETVLFDIQHHPSGIIDHVQNIVEAPITIAPQATATASYTVPTRPGDTFLLIYGDVRGVDTHNAGNNIPSAIEAVVGHQIRIESPLSIRRDGPSVIVRFRTHHTQTAHLETSTAVRGGPWQIAESVPPMPPFTMVERTYAASDPQRYFRLRLAP